MTISELIKVLNAKAGELGPNAEVRIEHIYDYHRDSSCGMVCGLAIGSRTERAPYFAGECLNSADRVKELDTYIEFSYRFG